MLSWVKAARPTDNTSPGVCDVIMGEVRGVM